MRFVTWNLSGFARSAQGEFLAAASWAIAAVQEMTTPTALDELASQVGASSYASARGLIPSATDRTPRYVSALLARPPWTLVDSAVLDVPSPERGLHAVAMTGDRAIRVASLALPPASSRAWGPEKKVEQADAIAGWLAGSDEPTIIGIDANTPRIDAINLSETCWWNSGEERLLGPPDQRTHGLRDVFREWVERSPERLDAIRTDRPDGPLAVSYRRGRGERAVDCRYDVILASPEIRGEGAGYEYEGAVMAGSDHALVWADLVLDAA